MTACATPGRIVVRGLGYGVRLTGSLQASRAPVLLLHGFAGSGEDWNDLAGALRAAGYASIAVDLPGHGRTDVPEDPGRFGMAATVRDLAAVLDALGAGAAHWLGYSMGARVALHAALLEPDRVLSLLLESASPGIPEDRARVERRGRDEALAASIESCGIPWFVEHWEAQPIFATQRSLPAAALAAQRGRRLRNRPGGLAGSLRGIGQGAVEDVTPRLGAIRAPALLLAGALDPGYAERAELLASRIPDAERAVVPDAGHNIHLERPEPFARAVLERLNRLEARARASTHTT